MLGFGFGPRPRRLSTTVQISPNGFANNGALNTALRAMITGVRAGTRRGRIVWKGDSTIVGQGAGTGAPYFLGGAQTNRVPAALAALLSAAGIPTLDNAMVADNGMLQAGGSYPLATYDPRFVDGGNGAAFQIAQDFAGGGYRATGTGADSFTPTVAVNRFEVVIFNSNSFNLTFLIDGAVPSSVTISGSSGSPAATAAGNVVTVASPGNGVTRIIVAAATTAVHTLSWRSNNFNGALRSVMGFASGTPAIDQLVHASLGARADQQGKDLSGSNIWGGLDQLGFDAPDLTIIDCGLNEMGQGSSVATYQAALQAMVTRGKVSGDVLLVFPYPAAAPYNTNVASYLAAAASVASSSGVSFMSLYDYYSGIVDTSRFSDALVHGKAIFYAEVAGVLKQAITAMNGGTL